MALLIGALTVSAVANADARKDVRTSLRAVRDGDEASRKRAYRDLHAAGYRAKLPAVKPGDGISCELLPVEKPFACEGRLWACVVPWMRYGSGGGEAGTTAIFGRDAEEMASWQALPSYEREQAASAANSVKLSWEEEEFCAYCEMHAWDCAASKLVEPVVEQCYRKATGAKKSFDPSACQRRTPAEARLCDSYTRCFNETCEKAQAAYASNPASWPEAAAEIATAQQACADCGIQASKTCEVIVVDPCAGRVGYACSEERRETKGSLAIEELTVREREADP